jgi:hypothetical protein
MNEEIKHLLESKKLLVRERSDREVAEWVADALEVLLRAELERGDHSQPGMLGQFHGQ